MQVLKGEAERVTSNNGASFLLPFFGALLRANKLEHAQFEA